MDRHDLVLKVKTYRGGYVKEHRRAIERQLFAGEVSDVRGGGKAGCIGRQEMGDGCRVAAGVWGDWSNSGDWLRWAAYAMLNTLCSYWVWYPRMLWSWAWMWAALML